MAIILEEGCLKIDIYHNGKNIDEESMQEEFEADMDYIMSNQKEMIRRVK